MGARTLGGQKELVNTTERLILRLLLNIGLFDLLSAMWMLLVLAVIVFVIHTMFLVVL